MRHSAGIMRFECYLPISSVIREATLRALAFSLGPDSRPYLTELVSRGVELASKLESQPCSKCARG